MGSLNDKVRKARILASKPEVRIAASETAMRNAKAAGIKLTPKEEAKAAKVIGSRIKTDRTRTASRAVGIEKMQAKKTAAKRLAAATGNSSTKKSTTKPAPKRKYTKSEQDFIKGEKLKAKILKETGVYKNTAN